MIKFLTTDLLSLAELENNKFSFNNDYFDLLKVIKQAFNVIKDQAGENNIKLEAITVRKSDLNFFKQIYGDERRYLQIVMNFLSNAIKFTNKNGSV